MRIFDNKHQARISERYILPVNIFYTYYKDYVEPGDCAENNPGVAFMEAHPSMADINRSETRLRNMSVSYNKEVNVRKWERIEKNRENLINQDDIHTLKIAIL